MAGGSLLHAWIFGPVIITVGYWEQIGIETEIGSRVEIRRVQPEPVPGANPGVAGFRVLPVSDGIWRADLFTGPDGPIYHYHPAFEDGDVGERHLDPHLTADPVAWAMDQLADIRTLLEGSGAADVADAVPQAHLDVVLPEIRRAIERSFAPIETQVGRAG
ncbi:MAG: hypothetical protein U0869_04650 [Chloroflexota bacterium]